MTDAITAIKKKNRINELNDTKNQIWNAIRRFDGLAATAKDEDAKSTYQNKAKALHEDLEKAGKELATLK